MTPSAVSKEERRKQIIQAAVACFARKGYHLTTMDDIVAESGLSKGSLYWHFKNKKDLFVTIMSWYFDRMAAELVPAIERIPTVVDRLNMMFAAFAEVAASADPLLSVFIDFYAQTRNDEDIRRQTFGVMETYINLIAQNIRQGIDAGELRPLDARQVAVAMMAAFDGLFLYQMLLGDAFDWRRVGVQFGDVVLNGLRATKE